MMLGEKTCSVVDILESGEGMRSGSGSGEVVAVEVDFRNAVTMAATRAAMAKGNGNYHRLAISIPTDNITIGL